MRGSPARGNTRRAGYRPATLLRRLHAVGVDGFAVTLPRLPAARCRLPDLKHLDPSDPADPAGHWFGGEDDSEVAVGHPEEDRAAYDALVARASSSAERDYLGKALSCGHPVWKLEAFAEEIRRTTAEFRSR